MCYVTSAMLLPYFILLLNIICEVLVAILIAYI